MFFLDRKPRLHKNSDKTEKLKRRTRGFTIYIRLLWTLRTLMVPIIYIRGTHWSIISLVKHSWDHVFLMLKFWKMLFTFCVCMYRFFSLMRKRKCYDTKFGIHYTMCVNKTTWKLIHSTNTEKEALFAYHKILYHRYSFLQLNMDTWDLISIANDFFIQDPLLTFPYDETHKIVLLFQTVPFKIV